MQVKGGMSTAVINMQRRKLAPELKNVLRQASGANDTIENQLAIIQERKKRELTCYLTAALLRIDEERCSEEAHAQRARKAEQVACLVSILRQQE